MVAFQHGAYVREAITSALEQTFPPLEVVVVDDGSTDDTVLVARSIADHRVRLVAQRHEGIEALAGTYTRAAALCQGDLVALLEADDRWPVDKLERQVPHFSDSRVVVSHGAYQVIGARGTVLRERVVSDLRLPEGTYDALPLHLLTSYVMAVTAVIRRTALSEIGGFRQLAGTPHWDYPTFLALARTGSFAHTREVVGTWRKHSGSGTMHLAGTDLGGVDQAMGLALLARAELGDGRPLPSERDVRRSWTEASARNVLQVTRILLTRRRYSEARSLAWGAIRRPIPAAQRARLLAVMAAATGHFDLERMSRLLGRHSTIEELA
jgi:glycosyltransferase involved in cell wall biosynthesis